MHCEIYVTVLAIVFHTRARARLSIQVSRTSKQLMPYLEDFMGTFDHYLYTAFVFQFFVKANAMPINCMCTK